MINTVKLTKNSNGSYYAYVTTNTPANMGEIPVTFTDTAHHSELISNTLINGFYQSVVRLTLSPSEISSPISTNIHVIVPGINYNNLYVIRLVIGDTAISNIDDSKNSSSSDKPKKPSDSDQPKISSSESSKNSSQSSKISSSSSSEKPKSSSQSSKINSSSSSEKAKNSSESSKISSSSSSEKAKSSSQSSKTSSSSAKSSSTTPVKKPDGPTKPVTSETRNLRILQDKSDKPSMAAKYILDTVKLDENTDGSYYAYVTTHTPAMMGKQPITFTDTQRTAKFMSTKLINGYYQSVIRLKLSASELAAPILTHIHVEFKQPIAYNDTYGIRLVIASSANDSSKSSSESSKSSSASSSEKTKSSSQSSKTNNSSSSENAKSSSQSSKINSSSSSEKTNSSSESSKTSNSSSSEDAKSSSESSKTNSSSSSENTKSSSTTPITKPDTPKTDITEEMRSLTILQSDNDKPSMAATYMLPTIKLVKNADGSYFAFITTHTPEMMGQSPITFNDATHDAKVISTELDSGFYQSVVRLTLSPSELSAPIITNIHVAFTQPMPYDNYYSIRLVIGDNTATTSTSQTSNSVADNTPTVVAPDTAISTAGMSNNTTASSASTSKAPVDTNSVTTAPAVVMPQSAVKTPQHTVVTTNQAQSATQKSTSEKKQHKIHVAQKHLPATNSSSHLSSVKVTAEHSNMSAVMIAIGASIATAIGFIGTSLALNIWRKHNNND